jgi:hypothetical protein
LCHGCYAEEKNGSAASELRCRCAWLHHGSGPRARRIQGCGAIDPRPKASSPLIAIPTAPSVPSCSELSRYGLARAEHAARLVRRPTLTAPARDEHGRSAGRDEGTAFGSNKGTDEGGAPACRNSLTRKAPYKAQTCIICFRLQSADWQHGPESATLSSPDYGHLLHRTKPHSSGLLF